MARPCPQMPGEHFLRPAGEVLFQVAAIFQLPRRERFLVAGVRVGNQPSGGIDHGDIFRMQPFDASRDQRNDAGGGRSAHARARLQFQDHARRGRLLVADEGRGFGAGDDDAGRRDRFQLHDRAGQFRLNARV